MFILVPAFATFAAADVMFITATMALNTIVEAADAFLDVLVDIGWRVLMASVTGIAAIVVAGVTGHTARVVLTI